MAGILLELRQSARRLLRTPVLMLALVLSIALGIASNASVDGFTRGLLAQEQPFPVDAIASIGRLLRSAALGIFAIACANVAAFLLARDTARSRETAVRVAIGAGRRDLIRHVLADSLLVSTAGAIAGVVLAYWIGRIVPAMLFDQDAARMHFAADPSGTALIALGCTAIAVACGLLPLLETRHDDPGAIMQRENSGPSRRSVRIGAALVVMQMAACTLLMISAGLLYSGYRSTLQTTAGRRLANATIASMEALQMSSESQQMNAALAYQDAAARVAAQIVQPRSVAWAANLPGNRPVSRSFRVESATLPVRELTFDRERFTRRTVDRIITPPLAGRLFGAVDSGPCGGVVLSATAARQLGSQYVIGRSIETPSGDWSQIVGVVRLQHDEDRAVVFHYAPDSDQIAATPSTYRVLDTADAPAIVLDVNVVSSNYFDVVGLPILAGQTFGVQKHACRVAIVNKEAADRYFGGEAVGGAVIDSEGTRASIIGVVGSTKLRAAQRDVLPTLYMPLEQDFQPRMTMILETGAISRGTLRRLHERLAQIPGGREDRITVDTLDHHLSRTAFAPERIATVLVGASAAIALTLGLLGLYGVMSDAARRRRREFALRIALGAQSGHLIGQVVAEGVRLVMAGALSGVAASFVVARWVSHVAPTTDGPPLTVWLSAPILLVIAVGIASVLPARNALATDPLLIMRSE